MSGAITNPKNLILKKNCLHDFASEVVVTYFLTLSYAFIVRNALF